MLTDQPVEPRPAELPDDVLVARILGGEARLFEVLMRRHNRRVFRAARSVVGSDAEAEDVMQEAYVSAYAHLAGLHERSRFAAWLTRIAVREALAHLHRRGDTVPIDVLGEESEPMSRTRTPESAASNAELARILEGAVDALAPAFRTVFMLRLVEGMSAVEVAEVLAIPEETVRTRLHRARERLRDDLLARVDAVAPDAFDFHLSRCDRVVTAVLGRLGIAS